VAVQDEKPGPSPFLFPLVQPPLGLRGFSVLSSADEHCKDKFYNCNVVVQARLCVYTYYKTACCASCTRVASRHTGFLGSR
jgi:hypothetical protein